jgi:uncharacterized membrane protein
MSLFRFLDGFLGRHVKFYLLTTLGFYVPGTGIILFLLLLFLIGFFMKHFFGAKLFPFFEKLFLKIPFVKMIYPAAKQIINFLVFRDWRSFQSVVLIEYPRKGIYSVGFVTNKGFKRAEEKLGKELVNVFVPNSPGPLTGYVMMIPRRDLIFLDISIEEGLRLVVSGGVVNPESLTEKVDGS